MNEPYKVELTNRRVIEHKLLTALGDADTVAILASKQDLEDMIAALNENGVISVLKSKEDVLSWEARVKRRKNLADGMSKLMREAFNT